MTFLILAITIYITIKLTKLYCIFKYKNDIKFIDKVLNNHELFVNLKSGGIFDNDAFIKMKEGLIND